MKIDDTKRFTFVSKGTPEETFSVVKFKGTEGISRLYEFDITLASDNPEIDLKKILHSQAVLTILGIDQNIPIHGILAEFEQLNEVKGQYFYRAILVPRLWQADLYRENQLFLDNTVPDIIKEILRQTGLTTRDYELKLTRNYQKWEYICQYKETDFEFISRWMEREGIYYFFEQTDQNEKLIITDSSTAHKDISGNTTISLLPPSGMVPEEEAIMAFICRQKRLPNKVILKDYNYRKPSLDLKAEAEVDPEGRGNVYIYGEHFKTPEEGMELAKIRAEEIRSKENVFHGQGTAESFCPGFLFKLVNHYREDFDQKYLLIDIEHEGNQTGSSWAGIVGERTDGEQKLTYANSFTAIPANIQFRPEIKTPKPRFYGTMNAKVDAAGIGQYAEIDEEGRYKVILPFDMSDSAAGKASRWVRMAQPYAGTEHGMHFPLHKGTEILLTFVDGDPDRPIIAGAVPNVETKSVVTGQNYTKNKIRSAGGNVLEMEDQFGKERILLQTPMANSWIRMGSHNDPNIGRVNQAGNNIEYVRDFLPGDGIRIYTNEKLTFENPLYEEYHSETSEDQKPFNSKSGQLEIETAEKLYNTVKNDNQLKENKVQLKEMEEHDHVRVRLGELIEVRKGDSTDIEYGGKHVDWLYRDDGTKRHYIMESGGSEDNWYEEKRWWRDGTETYSKTVDQNFNTTEIIYRPTDGFYNKHYYETWPPKLKIKNESSSHFTEVSNMNVERIKTIINNLAVGLSLNIDNSAGNFIKISNMGGTQTNISTELSAKIDINTSASLSLKLSVGAGLGLDIDTRVGGAFKLAPSKGLKFDAVGLTLRSKAALDIEEEKLKLRDRKLELSQLKLALRKLAMECSKADIKVENALYFMS